MDFATDVNVANNWNKWLYWSSFNSKLCH